MADHINVKALSLPMPSYGYESAASACASEAVDEELSPSSELVSPVAVSSSEALQCKKATVEEDTLMLGKASRPQ